MSAEKKDFEQRPVQEAIVVADKVSVALLKQGGKEVYVAGSIRRECEMVRDIDLVAVIDGLFLPFGIEGLKFCKATAHGEVDGWHVDVWWCKPGALGSMLLHCTGSMQENVWMRKRALKMGMKLNQYGLWKDDERVAGETEGEVYAALQLKYRPPVRRNGER